MSKYVKQFTILQCGIMIKNDEMWKHCVNNDILNRLWKDDEIIIFLNRNRYQIYLEVKKYDINCEHRVEIPEETDALVMY